MIRFKTTISIILTIFFIINGCSSDEQKKAAYLKKGIDYFNNREYKNAKNEFQNLIKLDPNYSKVYPHLAKTYLMLGNLHEALEAYNMAIKLDPSNKEAQLKIASFHMLDKNFKQAEQRVDNILKKYPDNPDALYLLATIMDNQKKFNEAEIIFRKILKQDPKHTGGYIGLSQILVSQKRLKEAENVLNEAVRILPNKNQAIFALFSLYNNQENFTDAEKQIQKIIKADPEKASLYIILGQFYVKYNKQAKASEAFAKAIQKSPSAIKPYLFSASFYESIGNNEKALAMYEEALAMQPDNTKIINAIIKFYLKNKNIEQASLYIDQILKKRPRYLPTRILQGELLILDNQFDKASSLFTQLISENPGSYILYYFRSIAFLKKGNTKLAKQDLHTSLNKNSGNISAKLLLSEIYLHEKKFDSAKNEIRDVMDIVHPDFISNTIIGSTNINVDDYLKANTNAHIKITVLHSNLSTPHFHDELFMHINQRYDFAIESFEQALVQYPNNIDILTSIIFLHIMKKEYNIALQKCDKQIEKIKNIPELKSMIYNLKGGLLTAQNRFREAETLFKLSIQANPNFMLPYYSLARLAVIRGKKEMGDINVFNKQTYSFHMFLGIFYTMQKQYDMAEKHYQKALSLNPNFINAAYNLIYLLIDHKNEINKAMNIAQNLYSKIPDNPFLKDAMGWIFYKQGIYDKAAMYFKESILRIPSNPNFHYHLGMTFYKQGNMLNAQKEFYTVLKIDKKFEKSNQVNQILVAIKK